MATANCAGSRNLPTYVYIAPTGLSQTRTDHVLAAMLGVRAVVRVGFAGAPRCAAVAARVSCGVRSLSVVAAADSGAAGAAGAASGGAGTAGAAGGAPEAKKKAPLPKEEEVGGMLGCAYEPVVCVCARL